MKKKMFALCSLFINMSLLILDRINYYSINLFLYVFIYFCQRSMKRIKKKKIGKWNFERDGGSFCWKCWSRRHSQTGAVPGNKILWKWSTRNTMRSDWAIASPHALAASLKLHSLMGWNQITLSSCIDGLVSSFHV